MSFDALSSILPAQPISQDTIVKVAVPAVSGSASSDKGTIARRVEASEGSATSNKVSTTASQDHVDERV